MTWSTVQNLQGRTLGVSHLDDLIFGTVSALTTPVTHAKCETALICGEGGDPWRRCKCQSRHRVDVLL